MTDDLVKRLLSAEVFIDTGGMISPVAYQAADRIEELTNRNKELETALREIEMLHYDSETDFHHDAMKAHDIARAALGEKKDD